MSTSAELLSHREVRTLRASLAPEYGNDHEIAAVLGIKTQTLRNRRQVIYQKLDVHGRNARWHAARKLGWFR